MLGRWFIQRLTKRVSFVQYYRCSFASLHLRLRALAVLLGAALSAANVVFVHPLFAQLTPDPVAEIIRTQLEARKPPPLEPEPVVAPPPADVSVPPPTLDANADPANDTAPDTADTDTSAPTVAPAPPVRLVRFIPPKLYAGKELIRAVTLLTRFYEGREYQPAWTTAAGLLPQGEVLLSVIQEESGREGLHASDYHLAKIKAVLADLHLGQTNSQKAPDPALLADLDFLLTDAFLLYGANVSLERVNLNVLDEKWFAKNKETDLVPLLQNALTTNRLVDTIKSLPPQQDGYIRLRDAFARYRDIAAHGGWPTIPAGPALALGASGPRVAKLRAHLVASGDLSTALANTPETLFDGSGRQSQNAAPEATFDQDVEQAVQKFQRRHAVNASGVVSGETLALLNISAETRVRQIAINMERWRSLPQDLGHRHIAVNVPNFTLEVVENDHPVLDMKVVVGKMIEERATPTFSANMTYVVLNPYWYVPKNIAEKELWPLHQRNPQYFGRNNFDIHRIPIGYKQVADPNATDGAKKSVRVYDYVIRQGPGPKNALGRVKFMFPNAYSVYLHDTPSKDLFNRTVRAFSHGCIRIEKPLDLAEYILRDAPKWSKKAIQATLRRDKEQTVYLPEPIPVHIQYWTAWVNDEGELQFRNDIYRYDRLIPGSRLPKSPPVPRVSHYPRPKVRKRVPKVQPPAQPPATVPVQASAGQ